MACVMLLLACQQQTCRIFTGAHLFRPFASTVMLPVLRIMG